MGTGWMGMGPGSNLATCEKPVPVAWVCRVLMGLSDVKLSYWHCEIKLGCL